MNAETLGQSPRNQRVQLSTPGLQSSLPEDELFNEENSEHELPFKVMGVAGKAQRQTYLEKAFIKRHDGSEVSAQIRADPTNAYDANAICVEIDYGEGWKVVGFLLKDLTQYVHPVIQSGKLSSVTIDDIRFRTQWSTPGFYIKLKIKCRGAWPQEVIRASQKVQ